MKLEKRFEHLNSVRNDLQNSVLKCQSSQHLELTGITQKKPKPKSVPVIKANIKIDSESNHQPKLETKYQKPIKVES